MQNYDIGKNNSIHWGKNRAFASFAGLALTSSDSLSEELLESKSAMHMLDGH
jgi:hypothetical protein